MGIEGLIAALVIGAIAGWLAGQIVRGGGFGLIGNIVVGIIGGLIAGYLVPTLGWSFGNVWVGAIISSTIGAVILLLIISLVKRA
ncbi:GlsB/YeaQ/YmgE family stress response membrane protein [soil metagenome]